MKRQALPKILMLASLALLLQACGFHLRGMGDTSKTALPSGIGPVQIQGLARGDFLHRQLEEMLIDSAAGFAGQADKAGSQLRISGRVSDRRVLAVDSRGKVIEYELREGVSFSLIDPSGAKRVPEQSVTLLQNYLNPEQEVLGAAQEEQRLREEMQRRMADQIMRRMAAQLR